MLRKSVRPSGVITGPVTSQPGGATRKRRICGPPGATGSQASSWLRGSQSRSPGAAAVIGSPSVATQSRPKGSTVRPSGLLKASPAVSPPPRATMSHWKVSAARSPPWRQRRM